MKSRVLITRSEKRAARLISLLRNERIDAFALPVTELEFITDNTLPDLNGYNWLAFTSVNGVTAFYDSTLKIGISLPDTLKIAAVGEATAKEIESRFRRPDLIASNSDGYSMAGDIIETADTVNELSVLWPCAESTLPDFPNRLKEAGVGIDKWICYRVNPIKPELLETELKSIEPWDIVLFAAPSAVRAFASAWPDKTGFIASAIGHATLNELKKSGFSDRVVCDGTNDSDCAATINRILAEKNVENHENK